MSFSDSPLSTDEPAALIDIASAESRFAASSKLDERAGRGLEEEVDDGAAAQRRQLLHLALERRLERARGAEHPLDVVARQVGDREQVPARRRPGRTQVVARRDGSSGIGDLLLGLTDEQDLVDLVDLDELHLDALGARGRQVLADVVGADRQLAVAAVDEDRELHACGPAVVEQRVDRGADRAAGVEHVVDEDAGLALEREVEPGRPDDRLRVSGASPPRTWTSSR